MLVGLTAQSLTISPSATITAFSLAAIVFSALLMVAAFSVSYLSPTTLKPIRMTGSAVRTFSGYVMLAVGVWFILLAFLPSPLIGV